MTCIFLSFNITNTKFSSNILEFLFRFLFLYFLHQLVFQIHVFITSRIPHKYFGITSEFFFKNLFSCFLNFVLKLFWNNPFSFHFFRRFLAIFAIFPRRTPLISKRTCISKIALNFMKFYTKWGSDFSIDFGNFEKICGNFE